jgi:pentatricopeptide repeat protein
VHELSAQGRTRNARELFDEMRGSGLLPTEPACNAFVSALAMAGESGDAERVMRVVDDITRRALVEELWRAGKREDADRLAREMEEKGIVNAREL